MIQSAERLKAELSQQAATDRAELLEFLLISLDGKADAAVQAAWEAEVARRVEQIKSGPIQGIPSDEVLARLRLDRGRSAWTPETGLLA